MGLLKKKCPASRAARCIASKAMFQKVEVRALRRTVFKIKRPDYTLEERAESSLIHHTFLGPRNYYPLQQQYDS